MSPAVGSHAGALNEQLSQFARNLDASMLVDREAPSSLSAAATPSKQQEQEPPCLSRRDLIEIILSLQEIQNLQMDRLQNLVDRMECEPPTSSSHSHNNNKENAAPTTTTTSPAVTATTQHISAKTPKHWIVGRPLDTLIETEPDTDANNSATATPAAAGSAVSSLASSSIPNHTTKQVGSQQQQNQQPHVHWHNPERMEAQQQGKETATQDSEVLLEYSQDGDDDDEDEEDDEYDTLADDSALYCPTIINNKDARRPQQHSQHHKSHVPSFSHSHGTPLRRLSHIEVDMAYSPAPTNLTMDTHTPGMYWHGNNTNNNNNSNKTALSHHPWEDDLLSANSEETPVLDRYRLEESPHGLMVVPNQRRPHRRTNRQTTTGNKVGPASAKKSTTTPQPAMPSASKRVFRKTPFRSRHKTLTPSTPTTIDEHKPLLYDPTASAHSLLEQYDLEDDDEPLLHSPEAVNNLLPKRLDALEASTNSNNNANNQVFFPPDHINVTTVSPKQDHQSLPSSLLYASTQIELAKAKDASSLMVATTTNDDSTPSTRRHSALVSLSSEEKQKAVLGSPWVTTNRRYSTMSAKKSDLRRIATVTQDEYNDAPRLVQMQVSLEDVNASIQRINQAHESNLVSRQFTETRAKLLLQSLGFSQRKCKTILMSLCHWRRLVMKRLSEVGMMSSSDEAEQGLVFQVV